MSLLVDESIVPAGNPAEPILPKFSRLKVDMEVLDVSGDGVHVQVERTESTILSSEPARVVAAPESNGDSEPLQAGHRANFQVVELFGN